ncbi:methylated-DNA--[protein]-cysteine S-methyltransferase [Intrasporangium calvum]|uniref:Methylated-DNA--protein-cysteine methyltransferase n=1 Tax=Intrasporangium calvum (strain ATCC 23552 / DSM 43043 / JCM 3097 / NBRC 12989 / NCIMB 10167 / NRRL B-3866 / 7 KIP) TaxID=710696 RepID=E6SC05_INTC7|nr:methylated-DNA--[protein]-cysteine S-methyltransferase [Intrasporangium calvum]ADU49545.1 methylated-DNA/protein-cysteinemethyltransferase [Intrasporangium calvum DSM 43043]
MSPRHVVLPSPVGVLTVVAGGGAITHLLMDAAKYRPADPEVFGPEASPDEAPFAETASQLEAYFAGELREFDLPLAPRGDDFHQRVWALLRAIPYGETRTYGDLARALGDRNLAQAVGTANGRNPIAIVVPCHRVIGSDGSLVGYAGGLDRKRFLLALEEPPAGDVGRLF